MDADGIPIRRSAGVRSAVLQVKRAKMKKPPSLGKASSRILAQEKRRKALELRKAGASYPAIAQAIGYYDQSGARKAVMKAFNDIIQEPVAELKTIQVERLNHMLMTLWPRVQQGDESAINTSLRVMDKMDRLMGTEAASATDINVNHKNAVLVVDGSRDDYIRAMQQMAGLGVQADGTNGAPRAIEGAQVAAGSLPPGMGRVQERDDQGDVVEGVIVEDEEPDVGYKDCPSPLGAVCRDPNCPLHYPQNNPQPVDSPVDIPRKVFSFGVDPTIRRKA